jgi:hypothetical protein
MPGGDQTGPEGMGPLTGRQLGDCADNDAPRSASAAPGRGWGWRRGPRGRRHFRAGRFGFARRFGRSFRLTQEQEVASLKDKAAWLKEQLDVVSQRLEEIKE